MDVVFLVVSQPCKQRRKAVARHEVDDVALIDQTVVFPSTRYAVGPQQHLAWRGEGLPHVNAVCCAVGIERQRGRIPVVLLLDAALALTRQLFAGESRTRPPLNPRRGRPEVIDRGRRLAGAARAEQCEAVSVLVNVRDDLVAGALQLDDRARRGRIGPQRRIRGQRQITLPQILQHRAKTGGVEFPFAQLAGEERGEFRREPMRIGAIVERGERVVRQERSAVDRPCVEAVAALYVTEDIFGRDARAWVGKRGKNSVHVEYRYAVMEGGRAVQRRRRALRMQTDPSMGTVSINQHWKLNKTDIARVGARCRQRYASAAW